uniref:Uncharacterized protein n=1 Tax=Rhipicephalus appendiculatus TaxID=34631 RepID=A0A131YEM5_RHIAP
MRITVCTFEMRCNISRLKLIQVCLASLLLYVECRPLLEKSQMLHVSVENDYLSLSVFKDIYFYFAYPRTLPKIFICVQLLHKKLS